MDRRVSAAPDAWPAFGVMQAMLRDVTERLAVELIAPSGAAPPWSELQWAVARSVASMQGLSGLLASRLRWRAPVDFLEFVAGQREQVAAVQQNVRHLLAQLDTQARAAGVPFIALKGSALLALDLHAPGERPMGDIDVLVAGTQVAALSNVIMACGYETAFSKRRHDVFQPLVRREPHAYAEHRDNPLRIEVHTHVSEALPVTHADITASLWPANPVPGINPYPGIAALMRHLLLHAAGNMRARALRMVQLYDIAVLARRMTGAEWQELTDGRAATGWWMYPPLALAERYLPGAIPAAVLTAARAACPGWLRWRTGRQVLYDVSWSNLRVEALPGVEWSRSPGEALRYAYSRVFPSSLALQELEEGARSMQGIFSVPWYQIPHAQRVLRWLFSRPPRVQTVVCLRAALGSGPEP